MTDQERPTQTRDIAFMRRALSLARKGWGQTAPNPMVGAVVVRGEEIVGEGWHRRFGGPHAEVNALQAAGERARDATIYVSLEPCATVGKTPPCTDAIIAAGVRRVVAAIPDPNPAQQGSAAILERAGIDVDIGLETDAARELNASFLHAFASHRPWVTLKLAMSIDGAIADATRRPGWLTGEPARREVHRLRAGSDAIAVGVETAMCDDPALTVRFVRPPRVAPRRVVFDRTARLSLGSALVTTAREVPTIVVAERADPARAGALRERGVTVIEARSLDAGLRALRAAGVQSLFVEGGARLAGALLERSLVDRLVIFQAPIVLGAGALGAFAHAPAQAVHQARRLPVVARRLIGDDLMTVYSLTAP
jgi:diaminohydroxyphosphoribosylaminopyrimidine deaminase/5-amino-6-(5-phosphoribosylamino)uracil reductase